MALKLDNSLLEELGLGALPESEKQLLLRQIYEKLEMNVGMRLADQMSNEQLDAFEQFVDANDDKGAFQWLESNFPNYKDVVNEEFEKLKSEIRSVAPQTLASAQQNAAMGQGAAAPQSLDQPGMPLQGQQPQYAPQPGQQQGYAPQPQPVQQPQQMQPQYGAPQGQPQYPQPSPQYQPQPSPAIQPQYGAPQPSQPQPYAQPQAPPQDSYGQQGGQQGAQPPQPGQYPPFPPQQPPVQR